MRAYSWIALGGVALACSGSAFTAETTDTTGDGGDGGAGDTSDGGSAGVLNRAGRASGGSSVGSGGKIGQGGTGSGGTSAAGTSSSGGMIGVAGAVGDGGDLVIGGSVSMAGTTSGAGMAGTGGTSPDPIDKVCPKTQPNPGASCVDGLLCSYGTDVRTACRPVAKCANGVWSINKPVCEQLHGCSDVVVGKTCDAGSAKPCLQNPTDSGVYCACTGCSGGAGVCSNQTVWACAGGSGGPACPKLPPNEGQMCSGATQCGYGSCATSNGVTAACNGSTWSWDGVACPL